MWTQGPTAFYFKETQKPQWCKLNFHFSFATGILSSSLIQKIKKKKILEVTIMDENMGITGMPRSKLKGNYIPINKSWF